MRLTGLDLKMEQYQAGERFVDTRHRQPRSGVSEPGLGAAQTTCPTLDEIRAPARWIARIDALPHAEEGQR